MQLLLQTQFLRHGTLAGSYDDFGRGVSWCTVESGYLLARRLPLPNLWLPQRKGQELR